MGPRRSGYCTICGVADAKSKYELRIDCPQSDSREEPFFPHLRCQVQPNIPGGPAHNPNLASSVRACKLCFTMFREQWKAFARQGIPIENRQYWTKAFLTAEEQGTSQIYEEGVRSASCTAKRKSTSKPRLGSESQRTVRKLNETKDPTIPASAVSGSLASPSWTCWSSSCLSCARHINENAPSSSYVRLATAHLTALNHSSPQLLNLASRAGSNQMTTFCRPCFERLKIPDPSMMGGGHVASRPGSSMVEEVLASLVHEQHQFEPLLSSCCVLCARLGEQLIPLDLAGEGILKFSVQARHALSVLWQQNVSNPSGPSKLWMCQQCYSKSLAKTDDQSGYSARPINLVNPLQPRPETGLGGTLSLFGETSCIGGQPTKPAPSLDDVTARLYAQQLQLLLAQQQLKSALKVDFSSAAALSTASATIFPGPSLEPLVKTEPNDLKNY